jgi:peroxiredoxin
MTNNMPETLLKRAALIAAIVALSGGALGCGSSTPSEAPDFTLPTITAANITLSELKGNPVVISFWYRSCPYCVEELPYFENVALQTGEITVLTVNPVDSNSTIHSFFNGYEPTMIVALDSNAATFIDYCQSYGNSRGYFPFTLLVDSEGIVRYIKIGAFGSETGLRSTLHDILGIAIPSAS